MQSLSRSPRHILIAGLLLILIPAGTYGQDLAVDTLGSESDISKLQDIVSTLQAEHQRSDRLTSQIIASRLILTRQDSLELRQTKEQQKSIRARIDILTMQLLWISERLQDPRTRHALARKMQTAARSVSAPHPTSAVEPVPQTGPVTARYIDLAAVRLIREEGLSLDQARLQVIEALSPEQISSYYAGLSREDRYALYDMIDEAVQTDSLSFDIARKSAIFFQLYAQ